MRSTLAAAVTLVALMFAGTALAENVLIYDDNLVQGASDLEEACLLNSNGHSCTRVTSEPELASGLDGGTYDIVMIDLQLGWFASPAAETAMLDFIDAGGFAVLHLIELENHATTAEALGTVVMNTHPSPQDVYGGGAMFNNAAAGGHSVPNPLVGGANQGGVDQELESSATDPSAAAHFHYDNVIQGPPAVVTSHAETVILLGFSPDETGQTDNDSPPDGIRDIREFLSNCIDYTLACSEEDADNDGYSPCDGDCDDDDDDINPDALEVPGDGVDSNCDGNDGDDADGDGYGSPESGGDDCDDDDGDVHPGAGEQANGNDDDCDGDIDEETELSDDDGDGYCEGFDLDGDGSLECSDGSDPGDCDDTENDINPDVSESCYDDIDNNCDDLVDGEDEVACPDVGDDDDDDDDTTGSSGKKTVGGCECEQLEPRKTGTALAALIVLGLALVTRRRVD